jgi:hypothetical protein
MMTSVRRSRARYLDLLVTRLSHLSLLLRSVWFPAHALSIAQFLAIVPALGRFSPTSCRRFCRRRTIVEGTAFVFQRTALDAHSTRKICGPPDHRLRTLDKQR